MKTETEKVIEICKNIKSTITKLTIKGDKRVNGFSNFKDNNPWSDLKPSKSQLKTKLNNLMDKYNITIDQLK
jgi:predicted  nucleic acid-binding Zn-ribbon protein